MVRCRGHCSLSQQSEVAPMIRPRRTPRTLIVMLAVAAVALVPTLTPQVHAQGLSNCVDVTGRAAGRVACSALVWANGVQLRMTFANQHFTGATPSDKVGDFYVVAPHTGAPQGTLPFLHDHVGSNVPAQNHGTYHVHVHGYFV